MTILALDQLRLTQKDFEPGHLEPEQKKSEQDLFEQVALSARELWQMPLFSHFFLRCQH